jgi:hypothetical protein
VPTPPKIVDQFPTDKLNALLSAFWDSKMQSPLKKTSALQSSGTVFALQPELSSQQAVGVLVSCVSLLGYRPSVAVIEKGGYLNKVDFVTGLLTKIGMDYTTKKGVGSVSPIPIGGAQNAAATI